MIRVKKEQLEVLKQRLFKAEDKNKDYHEILIDLNSEINKIVSHFLNDKNKIDFSKITKLLMKLQFGGDTEKIKEEIGINGLFEIKEKIDKMIADE